jgi:hypothetical protein
MDVQPKVASAKTMSLDLKRRAMNVSFHSSTSIEIPEVFQANPSLRLPPKGAALVTEYKNRGL